MLLLRVSGVVFLRASVHGVKDCCWCQRLAVLKGVYRFCLRASYVGVKGFWCCFFEGPRSMLRVAVGVKGWLVLRVKSVAVSERRSMVLRASLAVRVNELQKK